MGRGTGGRESNREEHGLQQMGLRLSAALRVLGRAQEVGGPAVIGAHADCEKFSFPPAGRERLYNTWGMDRGLRSFSPYCVCMCVCACVYNGMCLKQRKIKLER